MQGQLIVATADNAPHEPGAAAARLSDVSVSVTLSARTALGICVWITEHFMIYDRVFRSARYGPTLRLLFSVFSALPFFRRDSFLYPSVEHFRFRFVVFVAGRVYRLIGRKLERRQYDIWQGRCFVSLLEKVIECSLGLFDFIFIRDNHFYSGVHAHMLHNSFCALPGADNKCE